MRAIMASYYACVAEMDHELGRVIDRCAALGLLDNTVVIYTSDHGELLFDHGLIYKHNFFASSVDVPLVLAGPGVPAGRRSSALASLVDLLPTLLDFAGLPPFADAEGESLRPAMADRFDPDRPLFSEFHQSGSAAWGPRLHPTRMVRQGRWKYIYTHGMRDQLFDTSDDPHEIHDLAGEPAHADTLRRLRYLALRDWELDAQPQLSLCMERRKDGFALAWDSAGAGATYDVWREPEQADPELLATGLREARFTDSSGGSARYRVVAYPAFTRSFAEPDRKTRYGSAPVFTAEYPDFLPVTPQLVLTEDAPSAMAQYRPWYSVEIGAQRWIYEGMPPSVNNGALHTTGPCAILTPRFVTGDFVLKLEDLSIAWEKGAPGDEQTIEIVFGWDNAACTHAFAIDSLGVIRLLTRRPDLRVLNEAKPGAFNDLCLTRQSTTVTLSVDGHSILACNSPAVPSGRVGLNLGLGVAALSARLVLEK
jgi:hypothetical protein